MTNLERWVNMLGYIMLHSCSCLGPIKLQ